jgi:hypothetical protein
MRGMTVLLAVLVSAVALTGCGGDDTAATDTTTVEPPVTTTAPTETETPTPAATTPKPTQPKPTTVRIRVVGGVPQGGIARPKVKQGDRVVIFVRSDTGESVHMHGYDLEKPITPGRPVRLPLTATIPGRFEVELHHPDALLAVLTVTP